MNQHRDNPIIKYSADICRTSPFCVIANQLRSRSYQEIRIENSWGRLTAQGPQLSIQHEDIFLALLRAIDIYPECRIRAQDGDDLLLGYRGAIRPILLEMGKKGSKKDYIFAKNALEDLNSTVVRLEIIKGKRVGSVLESSPLLTSLRWIEPEKKIRILINSYFSEQATYGQINFFQRMNLNSPLARALQDLYQRKLVDYGREVMNTCVMCVT